MGTRLTYSWNVRQKRREIQLSSSQQFYSAYGEFFAVWKLWNCLDRSSPTFDDRRWELHQRAATAEATIEGTLVKLSSELNLNEEQIVTLGRFRQAFQQLRQSIREDRQLPWPSSEHAAYRSFKILAVETAILLSRDWPDKRISTKRASEQLMHITSNEWEGRWVDN